MPPLPHNMFYCLSYLYYMPSSSAKSQGILQCPNFLSIASRSPWQCCSNTKLFWMIYLILRDTMSRCLGLHAYANRIQLHHCRKTWSTEHLQGTLQYVYPNFISIASRSKRCLNYSVFAMFLTSRLIPISSRCSIRSQERERDCDKLSFLVVFVCRHIFHLFVLRQFCNKGATEYLQASMQCLNFYLDASRSHS